MNYTAMASRLVSHPLTDLEGELDESLLGADPEEYYADETLPNERRKAAQEAEIMERDRPYTMPPEFRARLGDDGAYPHTLKHFLREQCKLHLNLEDVTGDNWKILNMAVLMDHVALAEGFTALVQKVRDLQSALEGNQEALSEQLASVKHHQDQVNYAASERFKELDEKVLELETRGTTPKPVEGVAGLIGKIPTFSSERDSKMSFETWAKMFEEHALLRGVPAANWVALAKTNLAGKARDRWLAAEGSLNNPDWAAFCATLTPMFADADKRAAAVKAWGNLRPCTSMDMTAIRDYGRKVVTVFSDMGRNPDLRPITEKGAIDYYIGGLPEATKGIIAVNMTNHPDKYLHLESTVTAVTAAIEAVYPQLVSTMPMSRGRPSDKAGSSGTQTRDTSQSRPHPKRPAEKGTPVPRGDKRPRVPDDVLLKDPKLRAYASDPADGKHFSPRLQQLLRAKNVCLGCRASNHRIADCPKVPAAIREKWSSSRGEAMDLGN